METKLLFSETQWGFKNWILSVVIVFSMIPASAFLLFQATRTHGTEKIILLCTFLFTLILCILLFFIKLKIEVNKNEIQYRLYPFHFSTQTILKNEIVEVENVIYNPIGDWGGWGIRMKGRDRAYNMYGNRGVKLTMKNGKIILLGSQKSHLLYDAILKN